MRLAGLLAITLFCAGCGAQGWILAAKHDVLFQGFDRVTPPQTEVDLAVSLRGDDFVNPFSDYTVFFSVEGQDTLLAAKTDKDGIASANHSFADPGLYKVRAFLDSDELGTAEVPTCEITVAVFPTDRKCVVVDLDHTVVDAGLDQVLLGDPPALPNSVEVVHEIAKTHQVIFLTHRPEYLSARSKEFLREREFPDAPLLLSTVEQWASGSQTFKTGAIGRLKKTFPNVEFGVGDKITDGLSYRNNGMQAYVIAQTHKMTLEEKKKYIDALAVLDDETNVVTGWLQVRESLQTGKRFPRSAMQARLRAEVEGGTK